MKETLQTNDEHFMRLALREAQRAFEAGEVPVGAVIVCNGQVIARAHNLVERLNDPTAHAEMQAYTAAAEYLGGRVLSQCTLYVTLEPCLMCAGASFWAQLGGVVFGAYDDKRGYSTVVGRVLHPKTKLRGGVLGDECAALIKEFFLRMR
ncbi:MAG: nucleoside deaminase [Flavobacteriales bacterium]|jgi:tRNA(adenine34) deaminase|nr:nucleoside deaminase [Flavobacteriales bacterium]